MNGKTSSCPPWDHLIPKKSDDAATLRDKVEQLETLSRALRLTLARGQDEEKEASAQLDACVSADGDVGRDILADEFRNTGNTPSQVTEVFNPSEATPQSGGEASEASLREASEADNAVDCFYDGDNVSNTSDVRNSGLTLQLQLPVEAAKLSDSGRYLCGVLQCPPDSRKHATVRFVLWELGRSFAQPPTVIGTMEAYYHAAQSETSSSSSWDIMETSQGVFVVISGRFKLEPDSQEAVRYFLPETRVLRCVRKLTLNENLHTIVTTGNTIIAAGIDGKGAIWNDVGGDEEPSCKELPQARYKRFPFDWITELRLPEGKTNWVVGLSSHGSIVLWDHRQAEILTTVHHATFHISDIHLLPADTCSEGVSLQDSPLAFVGCIVERDNQKSQRSIAGMLLRNELFNIGSAFPVEGVKRMCGHHDVGLACLNSGEVVAWDVIQGKRIWCSDDYKGKTVTAAWMGHGSCAVVTTQCGIISVRRVHLPGCN